MIALWFAVAWACDTPVDSVEVARALDAASDRFAEADAEGFQAETRAALEQVACVRDPLEPRLVAALHRATGLLAFVARDTDRATTAFAAARSVEPGYTFPTSVLPEGHPIRDQYGAVDPDKGQTRAVGEPKSGRVSFDARATLQRPVDRPTVFQRFESGGVVDTAYLWPGDELPTYDAKRPPSPLVTPLWISTGAAAVLSGALLGGTAASRASFDKLPVGTPDSQARGAQARTNGLLLSSAGMAAVGVGTGVGALALTRW